MMNLTVVYRFQSDFFVAGSFSCPTIKSSGGEDKITLQMKRAKYEDKIFIKNKADATELIEKFKLKDFHPIKIYFEYEGYDIDDKVIDQIKEVLGGAEIIWVNFQDSTV